MSFNNQWNEISAPGMFERPADLSITYHPFNVQVLGDAASMSPGRRTLPDRRAH